MKSFVFRTALMGTAAVMPLSGAWAQQRGGVTGIDQPVTESAAEAPEGDGEIVVTAQRRSQRLQDVPISITAVSAEQAEAAGVSDVTNLPTIVPNMNMMVTVSGFTPFLRGVGSAQTGAAPNEEQPVATYVDGVYIASPSAAATFEFNNIERIEVLKGPQGTLFGRNATGGVIQIITREPQHEFSGQLSVGYGNFDAISGRGYLTGGLTENLAADVAVVYEDRNDGFGRNFTTGRETFTQNSLALRASLLFTPGTETRIRLSADYSRLRAAGPEFQKVQGTVGIDGVTTYPGPFNGLGENPIFTHLDQGGVSAHITQGIGNVNLVSITAYRELEGYIDWDQDATPLPAVAAQFNLTQKTFSQELQLQSDNSSNLEWMVGGFYYHARGGYDPLSIRNRFSVDGIQTTGSFSLFGQATLSITERTKVTAGLRYTWEEQEMNWLQVNPAGTVLFSGGGELDTKKLTWRFVVAHEFNTDLNVYASVNRGTHSGGFTAGGPGSPAYLPETLDAYEVGVKARLLNGMLRMDVAAFYYDYSDLHVKTTGNGVTRTENAATARIYGVDAQLDFRPNRHFSWSAGVGLLSARFTDFPSASAVTASGVVFSIDAAGNRLPVAPNFTANTSINYQTPLAGGEFFGSATLSYTGSSFANADNRLRMPSYTLVNGSIGWRTQDERFEGRLWVRNLTDATYYQYRLEQSTVGDAQVQAPPRTYGATLTTRF